MAEQERQEIERFAVPRAQPYPKHDSLSGCPAGTVPSPDGPVVAFTDHEQQVRELEEEREDWRGKAELRLVEWRNVIGDREAASAERDEAVAAKDMWRARAEAAERLLAEAVEEFGRWADDVQAAQMQGFAYMRNSYFRAANYLRKDLSTLTQQQGGESSAEGREPQVRIAGRGEDGQGAPAAKSGGPSNSPRGHTQPDHPSAALTSSQQAEHQRDALLAAVEPFTVDGGIGCGAQEIAALYVTYQRIKAETDRGQG